MLINMVYTYVLTHVLSWFKREEGATAVEYGLIVALIAVVIIGAVTAVGLAVSGTFSDAADAMP